MSTDAAVALGRTLARVETVDEACARRELGWRLKRDADAIRRGLEAWRAARTPTDRRERADLA